MGKFAWNLKYRALTAAIFAPVFAFGVQSSFAQVKLTTSNEYQQGQARQPINPNATLPSGYVSPSMPINHDNPLSANAGAEMALQGAFVEGAEWEDGFDSSAITLGSYDRTTPFISSDSIPAMGRAIAKYERIVASGGWQRVPQVTKSLRVGMSHDTVKALRQRLMVSGDLAAGAPITSIFDSYVDGAVRRFQLRYGLVADGVVGKSTIEAMNVPATFRLNQLRVNLPRIQELQAKLENKYVMVNIPAARTEVVENGHVHSRHTAVVGKKDRQTPILDSAIFEVNFNPYWTVPLSIIRRDLIPRMQKDPTYLAKNRIRIFDWHGKELQWQDIDWTTDEATQYRFTQEPGDGNSLGHVRINFHNTHQVYLHDTPEQSLFGSGYRFHSSGCVRVQNVREFVSWLTATTTKDWSRSRVDATIRSGERLDVKLKTRIPLHMVYVTAWSHGDGLVRFRDDIYGRDGAFASPVAGGQLQ
ncbi:L,D-transpeptidase family protein [Polycladidibacter stylochi]|uniref:L,D-transpeptidase family protein n=1 Tax=Polycladidibacter stylochi TaxID=1807766 RepID=UPI000A42F374|nr:L,D-transpeptidase family protein [Pseudovibrio stylochi]